MLFATLAQNNSMPLTFIKYERKHVKYLAVMATTEPIGEQHKRGKW